jgi:hypothetical protein
MAEPRWVIWRWEPRRKKSGALDLDVNGSPKWTKPPFQVRYPGQLAKSDFPGTWGPYVDAVRAVTDGDADGIGFALLGSDIGANDLDKCRDPITGKVEGWAEAIHDGQAYSEITVSGTGTRILGTARGPRRMRRFDLGGRAGIELFRNAERYITISGNQRGSCDGLPPIDDLIDAIEAQLDEEKGQRRVNGTAGGTGLDFNAAGQQTAGRDYDGIIRNGVPDGQRSEAFQSVVWHLAGKGLSADDITDELARYPNGIGAKYADRLHEEVLRSYGKWREQRRANATGEESSGAPWPSIYVVPGELPRVVDEAESALLGLGGGIHQRGGMIVRPALKPVKTFHDQETEAWCILEAPKSHLAETLTRAAQWLKYDGRKKGWVGTDAPERVVETYQGRVGEWRLPVLAGIIGAPCLRRDGSLHDVPGYDPVTGLLYKPECEFSRIPEHPTRDDAIAAMRLFDDLLAGFPFVAPTDKAVALSAILTAVDRHNMPTAPLLGFSATAPASGKSKLADIVSVLGTGRGAPVTGQASNEEELEKRLGAHLMQGASIIAIDNCESVLQSAFLCQVLTQEIVSVRVLGQSKNVNTSTATTILATGNNLQIAGDLTRRSLLCSLDAKCEHPERRKFDWDAKDVAKEQRGRLVVAALTMLRAWHSVGTRVERSPLGGFEEWSARIRAPLMWLGCGDPCETTLEIKAQDPKVVQLAAVIEAWREIIGPNTPVRVQDIINKAVMAPELHNALMAVAEAWGRQVISPERLGRWLCKVNGRIVSGGAIKKAGMVHGYHTWPLT